MLYNQVTFPCKLIRHYNIIYSFHSFVSSIFNIGSLLYDLPWYCPIIIVLPFWATFPKLSSLGAIHSLVKYKYICFHQLHYTWGNSCHLAYRMLLASKPQTVYCALAATTLSLYELRKYFLRVML